MPASPPLSPPRAFHVMTKPIGPLCNLDCKYCFYLEKEKLFPSNENFKMIDEMLKTYIQQYIEQQSVPEIHFAWQGGEPTLLGVEFFRKAVARQKKHANGKNIANAFQTNGTLLADEWVKHDVGRTYVQLFDVTLGNTLEQGAGLCHGECPKHRFIRTPDGDPGLNYLCAAYKRFFNHSAPAMRQMGQLLNRGRAPAEIMKRR